jgi:hypothetical protein
LSIKSVVGTFTLCDSTSKFDVTFEIKKNNKFISKKLVDNTKTIGRGDWSIKNDSLFLINIKAKQIPKPKTEVVYPPDDMVLILEGANLILVLHGGQPTERICLKRK